MVLDDNLLNIPKLVPGKPMIERDLYRLQPDLRLTRTRLMPRPEGRGGIRQSEVASMAASD